MHKMTLLMLACAAMLFQVAAANDAQVEPTWDPMRASYIIHSGGATYPEPPTKADRAITLHFEGKAAKDVFDKIGPDTSIKCSSEQRDRERRKKGVTCIYTAQLSDPKESHYTCWIGINLRTGDGDVRVSC